MIPVDEYVSFLDAEYLRGYVDGGGRGGQVRRAARRRLGRGVRRRFCARPGAPGTSVAQVDAAETRVHLLEQVFFDVARQVDWDDLATVATRRAVAAAGYPAPAGGVCRSTSSPLITGSTPGS